MRALELQPHRVGQRRQHQGLSHTSAGIRLCHHVRWHDACGSSAMLPVMCCGKHVNGNIFLSKLPCVGV